MSGTSETTKENGLLIDRTSVPKRKTISEYFQSASDEKKSKTRRVENQPKVQKLAVPGLELISNFVTVQEEAEVLAFLVNQEWRTDLSRRVIHYGGTYCLMPPRTATDSERRVIEKTTLQASPIPVNLDFIVLRMVEEGLYERSNKPEFCIVNEYKGHQGISAHVENFKFIAPVCGLTLESGDWMRFHELMSPDDGSVRSGKAAHALRTGKKIDIWMPPRSLLIMTGEAREKWQHEILRSRKGRNGDSWQRTSLTFRAEKK